MRKVRISADLERRLRARYESGELGQKDVDLLGELVDLLDEDKKRAAGSGAPRDVNSPAGYKELVALFRTYLGSSLLTPPRPNVGYIIKVVNKAKELGVDYTNVEQIIAGLRRAGRPPYRLWDVVYNADRYFADGNAQDGDAKREEDEERHVSVRVVHTGRPGDIGG